jgi:methyl-accepting chemotaxis protein
MDKVVQQNAANAEESASASEEMNAQAEQLKDYVRELVMLVTGRSETGNTSSYSKKIVHSVMDHHSQPVSNRKRITRTNEIRPEQLIPFDEGEQFKDF